MTQAHTSGFNLQNIPCHISNFLAFIEQVFHMQTSTPRQLPRCHQQASHEPNMTLHTHVASIRLRFAMRCQKVSDQCRLSSPTVRSSIPCTWNLFHQCNYSHRCCCSPTPWKSVAEFKSTCDRQCAGTDCEADRGRRILSVKTELKPRPPVSWHWGPRRLPHTPSNPAARS